MANRLLTKKEVVEELIAAIKKEAGGDIKKERAIIYDLQTAFGQFSSSPEERDRYIETGHS